MKFDRKRIKNIFIIILSVFVLIPIILMILNIDLNHIQEGMTTSKQKSGSDDPNYRELDRVDISGVTIPYDNNKQYIGVAGEYMYCLGGKISCPTGSYLANEVSYNLPESSTLFAHTYNIKCKDENGQDTSFVQCDNYLSKNDVHSLYFRSENEKDDYGNYLNTKYHDVTSSNSKKELTNSGLDGFTDPYIHAPMSISGDYVYLYNVEDGSFNFKAPKCFLYNSDISCIKVMDSDEIEESTNDDTCSDSDTIKCYANNGAEVGDPLCCGQSGKVQTTEYNCPSNLPYCEGYKCGKTWGKCISTRSQ